MLKLAVMTIIGFVGLIWLWSLAAMDTFLCLQTLLVREVVSKFAFTVSVGLVRVWVIATVLDYVSLTSFHCLVSLRALMCSAKFVFYQSPFFIAFISGIVVEHVVVSM